MYKSTPKFRSFFSHFKIRWVQLQKSPSWKHQKLQSTRGPLLHRAHSGARLYTLAQRRAELALSLNCNGLYTGIRRETQTENWWRKREYTVLCFSFEPHIKDSWLWTVQKAKGQARILRSVKNENKNTSTLLLLLTFIATSSQTVRLWQSGKWVVNIVQAGDFLEPFCKAKKWLEKHLLSPNYYSHAFPLTQFSCRLPTAFKK